MMMPPANPHKDGYFDGEIYGASDESRQGEWQPTFEFEAPAGSAVIVYPGMIHETASIGEGCSSSISQTFEVPVAAAYFRTFWPRFALVDEDVGGCGYLVETMVTLNSGTHVKPSKEAASRPAAKSFAKKADTNSDGFLDDSELMALTKGPVNNEAPRSLEELKSFHDVDKDGRVSLQEVEESWVMFAEAARRAKARKGARKEEL